MNTETMPGSSATRRISAATRGDVVGLVHRRHRAGAEEPALAFLGVVGAPVVVRARLRLGEVDVAHALQAEQHRGVQHREVDAVLVHVLEARLGVLRGGRTSV